MQKKTKILFMIHTLQVGGAEKILVNLVNNMDQSRFDITLMTVVDTGAFRSELNKNIKYRTIISLPINGKKSGNKASGNLLSGRSTVKSILANLYQLFWRHINIDKVYKRFIKEKYDIEVAFLEGIATKIIAHSDNPKSKKIAWVHIDLLEERKSEMFYRDKEEERGVYNRFDQIVTVSNLSKKNFVKKFDYDASKVAVQYNPIDTCEIKKKAAKEVENVKKNRFTLCTVGRLSSQKGFDRLLDVVKELNSDGLSFDLWLIGVGAEEEKLKEFIKNNKLDNVKMLGYKSNPYPYMKAADLYICSSITEGLSTTVSEAIVLGTPVVATDCSGTKELLGDSKYGIVCENSKEGIKNALRDVILDKKLYNKYKQKIKERASFFDLDGTVEKISKFFE